jgi:hypothetical protein
MYQLYCRLAVFVSVLFAQGQLGAKEIDNAVILLYHHVSTQTPTVTSVTPEVFRQHLAYLNKHHTVLPLTKVIEALKQKQALLVMRGIKWIGHKSSKWQMKEQPLLTMATNMIIC